MEYITCPTHLESSSEGSIFEDRPVANSEGEGIAKEASVFASMENYNMHGDATRPSAGQINNPNQQLVSQYTVTNAPEAEGTIAGFTSQLSPCDWDWLTSRLAFKASHFRDEQTSLRGTLDTQGSQDEDFSSQGLLGFFGQEEGSRLPKVPTPLAFGMRQLQQTARTSQSSSSTIDSDVHTLAPPTDPALQGPLLTNSAPADRNRVFLPDASQPMSASLAQNTRSLLPASEPTIEELLVLSALRSLAAERMGDQPPVQDGVPLWKTETSPQNMNVQQEVTPCAPTSLENYDKGPGLEVMAVPVPDSPPNAVFENPPHSGTENPSISCPPLCGYDGPKSENSTGGVITDGNMSALNTGAPRETFGEEVNTGNTLVQQPHNVCAQGSSYGHEPSMSSSRVSPASLDSCYTPVETLRVPLSPRAVTLPLMIEIRYLRFDPHTCENFLEIPCVNFIAR